MRTLAAVRKAPSAARRVRGTRGFTLAEVLIATAFIMVAFGSVGIGFLRGTSSVETGRQQTTALYLAEQRLEQIKAWSLSTVATQGFASVAAGAGCCRSEGYNTIADYGNYRRTVTVTSNGDSCRSRRSCCSPRSDST